MESVGSYTLDSEVARGGAGVVFRGHDSRGDTVAVKVLLGRGSAANPARFRREVDALSRLDHPGIVRLRHAGTTEHGQRYLVMDFVEGGSLQDRLARGPLPVSLAAQVACGIAHALTVAHDQGIVHRDVKPANVILTSDGRPLLTDFGLAVEDSGSHSLTQAGHMLGTPGYMPPEQITGDLQQLGPAADVYALGATLYACLTGSPPFVGQAWEVMAATTERPPTPPSHQRRSVDPALDAICLRCLRKLPNQRYANGRELARVLEDYLAGNAVAPKPLRSPLRWAIPVAALLTVALGMGLWWAWPSATAPTPAADTTPPEPTPAALARMTLLERRDDPMGSLALSLPLLARFPDDPRLLSHAGRAWVMLDDYKQGLPLLERATQLGPDESEVWLHWAIANLTRDRELASESIERSLRIRESPAGYAVRARVRLNTNDLEGARRDLQRAEALDPSYPHVLSTWAVYHVRTGNLDEALRVLDRGVREAPSNTRYLMRAQIRAGRGDPIDLVLAEIDAAERLRESPQAHELRATVLAKAGRSEESDQAWSRYIALRPDSPKGWSGRGTLRLRVLRQPEAALSDAQRASALAPESVDANHLLAMCYHGCDRDRDALRILDWVIERAPHNSLFRRHRARIRFNLRDFRGAYLEARKRLSDEAEDLVALELAAKSATLQRYEDGLILARRWHAAEPDKPDAFATLVNALWNSEEFSELVALTEGTDRRPLSSTVLAYRAAGLIDLGREAEANQVIERALRKDPTCVQAHAIRAEHAIHTADYELALTAANAMLAILPDSAIGHLFRSRARMELGQLAGARRDHERFCELGPNQLRPDDLPMRIKANSERLAQLENR